MLTSVFLARSVSFSTNIGVLMQVSPVEMLDILLLSACFDPPYEFGKSDMRLLSLVAEFNESDILLFRLGLLSSIDKLDESNCYNNSTIN